MPRPIRDRLYSRSKRVNHGSRQTQLRFESLEDRTMLAATTADIIFIVDESGSMTGGNSSGPRYHVPNELLKSVFETDGLIDALHERLAQEGVVDARYGLVAYGGDFVAVIPEGHNDRRIDPVFQGRGEYIEFDFQDHGSEPRPIKVNPDPDADNPYFADGLTAADDLKNAMTPKDPEGDGMTPALYPNSLIFNEGQAEDSWEAVDFVFNAAFKNKEDPIYVFREDAVVHFILISDDGRSRRASEYPVLPATPAGEPTPIDGIVNLATLRNDLARDDTDPKNDITLTAFVPVSFRPELPDEDPPTIADPILGVDMNVFEGIENVSSNWDVDLDVFTTASADYVVYHTDTEGDQILETHVAGDMVNGVPIGRVFEGQSVDYLFVRGELSGNPWSGGAGDFIFEPDVVNQGQIAEIGSRDCGLEENAFLAWETGGAVWNSAYLSDAAIVGNDRPTLTAQQMIRLQAGLVNDIVNRIVPPQVELVTIGSGELPNEETDSYDVPGGSGEQLRTVPVRKADRVTIRFSEEVIVTADDLALESAITGGPDPGAVVVDGFSQVMDRSTGTYTATWIFNEFEPNQIQLALSDDITDLVRNNLDGDWTNPASLGADDTGLQRFPSGNGVRGEPFVFGFTILPGDLNRNNIVGMADWVAMRANYDNYQTTYSFTEGDFNGNGVIDSGDYLYLFKPNAGRIFYFWGDENLLGDVNGDGAVNGVDVAPFIAVLIAGEYDPTADVRDDGNANGVDIGAFVDILVSGGFSAWLNQFGDNPFPGV